MLKRYLGRMACAGLALAALASCGDSKSGGTGEFSTVMATAGGPGGGLDADVAVWVSADNPDSPALPCGANSAVSTVPDSVDYFITSIPYPSAGTSTTNPPSRLQVSRVTLTFTPANSTTPALPPLYQEQFPNAAYPDILPNSQPTTIPVRVASHEMKIFMRGGLGGQSLDCSNGGIYTYRVNASFELKEVNTDRVATVTVPGPLVVRFADFADQ